MSKANPPHTGKPAYTVVGRAEDGELLVKPTPLKEDQLMSYANNYAQWTLHLMNLNDTAKEGDMDRMLLACKMNIPFFYSHSNLSKYFIENLDMLVKILFSESPLMQLRLLEGSFVNPTGGPGNNIEIDLAMEHSVRNRKDAIRNLGANKTEIAIQRVSMAADTVARVSEQIFGKATVTPKSDRHAKKVSKTDHQKVSERLRMVRPFSFRSGRSFTRHHSVPHSPFGHINKAKMIEDMDRNIKRSYLAQMLGPRRPQQRPRPRPRPRQQPGPQAGQALLPRPDLRPMPGQMLRLRVVP